MKKIKKLCFVALATITLAACGGNNSSASVPTSTSTSSTTVTSVSSASSVDAKVEATGVTLNETTKTVGVGSSFTLTATVAPENATDKTITWSSSDETIATVADGVVTASYLKGGSATITATTANGKTATCTVTVEDTPAARHAAYLAACDGSEDVVVHVKVKVMGYDRYANSATCNAYLQEGSYGYYVNNLPYVEGIIGKSYDIVTKVDTSKSYPTLNAKTANEPVITELTGDDVVTATTLTLGAEGNVYDDSRNAQIKAENVVVKAINDDFTFTFDIGETEYKASFNSKAETGAKVLEKAKTVSVGQKITSITGCWYAEETIQVTSADELVLGEKVAPTSMNDITSSGGTKIAIGNTTNLSVSLLPEGCEQSVTWVSSDTTKATVDADGVVTAVALGEVTITATSTVNAELTKSITLTIENISPTAITVAVENGGSSTVTVSDTLQLTSSVTPDNANDSVTWASSDTTKAKVDANGKVTTLAVGTVEITATSVADTTVSGSITITIEAVTKYTLTSDNLNLVTTYSNTTGTVYGVNWNADNCFNGSPSIQMRYKADASSVIYNTQELAGGISSVVLNYAAAKTPSAKTDIMKVEFFTALDAEASYSVNISTAADTREYVATPDANTYKFVKISHTTTSGTVYFDSIVVNLAAE